MLCKSFSLFFVNICAVPMYSSVSLGTLCLGLAGRGVDLDAAAAENQLFLSTRTSEKKEMIVLNDRLAVYIEKVRCAH